MPRQTSPCMTGIHGTLKVMNEGHDRQGSVQQCSSCVDVIFSLLQSTKALALHKTATGGHSTWGPHVLRASGSSSAGRVLLRIIKWQCFSSIALLLQSAVQVRFLSPMFSLAHVLLLHGLNQLGRHLLRAGVCACTAQH